MLNIILSTKYTYYRSETNFSQSDSLAHIDLDEQTVRSSSGDSENITFFDERASANVTPSTSSNEGGSCKRQKRPAIRDPVQDLIVKELTESRNDAFGWV